MTTLEFKASLSTDGTLKVPEAYAQQLKGVPQFQVVVLVPEKDDEDDDEAWRRLGLSQFFKGYAESDSIYDDFDVSTQKSILDKQNV